MIRRNVLVFLLIFTLMTSTFALSQDWNQWRGPNRNGTLVGFYAPTSRPESLTPKWSVEIGIGYSSPLMAGDKVYTFSRKGEEEVAACYELETGNQVWSKSYPAEYTLNSAARGHGKGPKSTPVFNDGKLYTLGISGILSCFDGATGDLKWQKDFLDEFPKTSPIYGTAMSPMVEGDMLIAHVGGENNGALIAFDKNTGDVKWSWNEDGPGYSSPVIMEVDGTRQIVTQSQKYCIGIDAKDGKLLWKIPFTTDYDQNIITPVIYKGMVIFAGIRKPTIAYKIANQDGNWIAEQIWSNSDISMYMSSPVLSNNILFGFTPKNGGSFFCLNALTGKTLWNSDGQQGTNAAIVQGQGIFFALTDKAELIAFMDFPGGFDIVAQYKVSDKPVWAHPIITNNWVIIKDETNLTCLSID